MSDTHDDETARIRAEIRSELSRLHSLGLSSLVPSALARIGTETAPTGEQASKVAGFPPTPKVYFHYFAEHAEHVWKSQCLLIRSELAAGTDLKAIRNMMAGKGGWHNNYLDRIVQHSGGAQ